jgi:hypothetical protein
MQDLVLFVHGYSVTNLSTYGGLPARVRNEARERGLNVSIKDIYLGRYISFNDEITLHDISRAFERAVREQLSGIAFDRCICITHSTGGPVVRNWLQHFYAQKSMQCPITHLIMLAPASHGSSLAQLGKGKLSRIKALLEGAEPGQKILDWLELGSEGSWALNLAWIFNGRRILQQQNTFLFVLIGQDIDRKLYDHVNSYTGETGSDGVVRVASANINSRYIRLQQQDDKLLITDFKTAPEVAFRIISQKSHSNTEMGIMKSVKADLADDRSKETIQAIFDAISVRNLSDYQQVAESFKASTAAIQHHSRLETEDRITRQKHYIHDRHSMLIFRVRDQENQNLFDFDLLLTGENNDPDLLPAGFFTDRQFNPISKSLTYYLNYDVMHGAAPVFAPDGELIRKALPGTRVLGLIIRPRPNEGMVHYGQAVIEGSAEFMEQLLLPNVTTHVEIVLSRKVSTQVFRFENLQEGEIDLNFRRTSPGEGFLA